MPFFRSKGLSDILGTFETVRSDLNALIARNSDRVAAIDAQIDGLEAEAAGLETETVRARAVASNITALIGN